MRTKTAESLAWVLIYGGLLAVVLGLFLEQAQARMAPLWWGAGALLAAGGAGLIFWRSRQVNESSERGE